jgi:hypothetical protein
MLMVKLQVMMLKLILIILRVNVFSGCVVKIAFLTYLNFIIILLIGKSNFHTHLKINLFKVKY